MPHARVHVHLTLHEQRSVHGSALALLQAYVL